MPSKGKLSTWAHSSETQNRDTYVHGNLEVIRVTSLDRKEGKIKGKKIWKLTKRNPENGKCRTHKDDQNEKERWWRPVSRHVSK